jgi:hypothetical protein
VGRLVCCARADARAAPAGLPSEQVAVTVSQVSHEAAPCGLPRRLHSCGHVRGTCGPAARAGRGCSYSMLIARRRHVGHLVGCARAAPVGLPPGQLSLISISLVVKRLVSVSERVMVGVVVRAQSASHQATRGPLVTRRLVSVSERVVARTAPRPLRRQEAVRVQSAGHRSTSERERARRGGSSTQAACGGEGPPELNQLVITRLEGTSERVVARAMCVVRERCERAVSEL